MNTRSLCPDGLKVTEMGLGCWQLGGGWGKPWNDSVAMQILESAYASGVRFFDTADVYGDGASEKNVGQFLKHHHDVFVATKLGRKGIYPNKYSLATLREATERSLQRLGVSRIDLTQLHCVPTQVLRDGEIFAWMDQLQSEGLIARYGASVESVEEGLICLQNKSIQSLQVIFNIFRQKPLTELFPQAKSKGVGIIVRLPLASGLLAGKMNKQTSFTKNDHRNFNRDGAAFNVGETFAGLPYELGVDFADQIKQWVPAGMTMAQMSLRWILDCSAVSVVIPGASSPEQAKQNIIPTTLPPLSVSLHQTLSDFYCDQVRQHIRGPY